MKKFLFIILISCFSLTIISCSDEKEEYSATGTTDNTTSTTTAAGDNGETKKGYGEDDEYMSHLISYW